MHLVFLTTGQGGALSLQHVHHQTNPNQPTSHLVDLLVLDARHMSQACLDSAMRAIVEIRARQGLRHGVLLCAQLSLPLIVASIRCGLRDVITQYISAPHLRQILRAALPSLSRREYRDAVAFLRIFSAFSSDGADSLPLARRAESLDRRAEDLSEQAKHLNMERDRLARLDQDLRDRTRRLDRQIARLQNDSDVSTTGSGHPFSSTSAAPVSTAEQAALTRRLEQRAAELDLREKLLDEMQTLLLSTPQAASMAKSLPIAAGRPGGRNLTGVIG